MACSWLPLISSSLDASMSGLAEQTLPWRSTMLTGTKRSSSKSEVHRPHKRKLNAQAGVIRCQDAGKISAEARDAALPQQLAEGFARVGLDPASQGKTAGDRVEIVEIQLIVVCALIFRHLRHPPLRFRHFLVCLFMRDGGLLHFGFTMATSLSL